jgi:hypothetical protein
MFLAAMLAIHAFFLWSVRGRIEKGDPDFTVFYTAGQMLREGRAAQLYYPGAQQAVQQEFTRNSDLRRGPLPYIHPPFEALIFLPLTFLPYEYAFALWNVANLGMLLAIATLLRRSLPTLGGVPIWEWVLAFLAFFPVFSNFLQGQDAVLLLLVFVLGFCALERDADLLAGCWFGIAVFKYHFVIPMIVILALWKGRKLAMGFTATASAAILLSMWIVGWRGALRYPSYAWAVVSTSGHGQTPLSLMPNLVGLLTGWPFPIGLAEALRWVAVATSLGLLVVVARMRPLANDRGLLKLCYACAVIAAIMVAYNTNVHDLCLLILPLALVADTSAQPEARSSFLKARLLHPIAPLLLSPLWFILWMKWGQTNLVAIFLLWWLYEVRAAIVRRKAGADVILASTSGESEA